MRYLVLAAIALMLAMSGLSGSEGMGPPPPTFVVDSTADGIDAVPGDGVCATAGGDCTLRAAVQEANASLGENVIELPDNETYTLSIPGPGEDAAATGDLDITDDVTIRSDDEFGIDTTVIDAAGLDRVFHSITPMSGQLSVNLFLLTIRGGSTLEDMGDPSSGLGGGVHNSAGVELSPPGQVANNFAAVGGGGIYNAGDIQHGSGLVRDNESGGAGGGLLNEGAYDAGGLNLQNNMAATEGGGVFNSGSLTNTGGALHAGGNVASLGGGMGNSGTADIERSFFIENSAAEGAGIRNVGHLTLTRGVFNENEAGSCGGAILNGACPGDASEAGTVAVTNSTISGNIAPLGAGVYNAGTFELTNATIVSSALGAQEGGMLSLVNTIVKDGPGGSACDDENPEGSIVSAGHNIDSDGSCGLAGPGDQSVVDPGLAPLAHYEGEGPSTVLHALLPDSPAIDAANDAACPQDDQRAVDRPLDGDGDGIARCDIGAYEFEPEPTPTPSPTPAPVGGIGGPSEFPAGGGPPRDGGGMGLPLAVTLGGAALVVVATALWPRLRRK